MLCPHDFEVTMDVRTGRHREDVPLHFSKYWAKCLFHVTWLPSFKTQK